MFHPVYSRMSSNYEKEEKPTYHWWCQEGPPYCGYNFNRETGDATKENLTKHYKEEHPGVTVPSSPE